MNNEDSIIVGIINFDSILNEKSIGKNFIVKGVGPYEIIIHPNEGENIPHFHITNNKNFGCCIRIYENRYFVHGDNTGKLNSKECKVLDAWLRKLNKNSEYGILTNWNYIERLWRSAHKINPPTFISQIIEKY